MPYATRADFEALGLRREVLVARARTVGAVDATANTIAVNSHGWSGSEPIQFSLPGVVPGATAPALPAPLSAAAVYYPLPVSGSDSLFQVAATEGGSAINITDAGVGLIVVTEQIGALIDRSIEAASSRVDQALQSYHAPLTTWPPVITWVTCKLAAWDVLTVRGLVDPEYARGALESLGRDVAEAKAYLKDWGDGGVLAGLPVALDDTPDVLEHGTVTFDDGPAAPNWLPACGGI